VWLDDGKIGSIIDRVDNDEIALTVTNVGGANLKAGKGINLPDTDLHIDALTPKDRDDLAFVVGHADVVNVSFVRRPEDVEAIQTELHRLGADDIGIVLKIENVAAFDNLPELLLTAMRSPTVGVMIARGDLAVEVGFERLAEVQEEIMWACEAAHVPVIWATQLLDTLARKGQPSRAEVTDAAMAERAECVMLNKGPHIADAIVVLDSILTRMQDHQDKKRSLLRRLHAWGHAAPALQGSQGGTDVSGTSTPDERARLTSGLQDALPEILVRSELAPRPGRHRDRDVCEVAMVVADDDVGLAGHPGVRSHLPE
jgi:pyruvate kinase